MDQFRGKVVQAPMAGTSTPALTAAVAGAGGFGFLAFGALDADGAARAMADLRGMWGGAFGVNLFCHGTAAPDAEGDAAWITQLAPEFARFDAAPPAALRNIYPSFCAGDDVLRVILAAPPAVVSCHFGLPRPDQITALRGAGCLLWATATHRAEAEAIRAAGFHAIVAQGWQAGGHRGMFDPSAPDPRLNTLDLLAELAPVGLPLIAAGGIMTRADARGALDAGAVAVQCGTAFLRAPESATSPAHRAALGQDTVMTRAISGRPARGVANALTRLGDGRAAAYPRAYDAGKALNAAAIAAGNTDYGAFWSGTGGAQAVARPAADTVAAITP
ncbi:nitronate monooxygenase family protein [Paracoccus sp. (in: a-proteobacteria)]|uniref:NAD(P)H-dependent flavin oxidoreductase n=1 Tax=Paracoccus sp. TaxID=267 RepID=UPI0026DF2EB6|nr:nitronate monooxygenase [Paracoccus sp. (in: a-proteobacteria)]MDO5647617.1 nitronate monooxygenase [Paracoccus sp. (in: a-proteobacteria)]